MVHIGDKTEVTRMSKEMPSGSDSEVPEVFTACKQLHEVKKVK